MLDALPLAVLIGSGLVILSVFTSFIAFRFGAPMLLLFLGLGLGVGEDGLGLVFDDAGVAYFIGSIALAIILFDAGFSTRIETITRSWGPALVLSTFGVVVTAAAIAALVHFLTGLSWLASFLLGAIISSTDAAAVFFLLRVGGIKLRERVRATLEVESSSNDPMAIFLTIALVEAIVAAEGSPPTILGFAQIFGMQIGFGALMGFLGGWAITKIVNRLALEPGLYPVLVLGLALFLFAITALIGGSGFLAVYIAGVISGNRVARATPMLRKFQDALTWMCQIAMFLMLGLLATPSEFGEIWLQGIVVALFLIFVARPLAVWLSLLPFGFEREETAFVAWVGLRGAVSILLAVLPVLAGIPIGQAFFNIAFIVVLTSLVVQGWTIRPLAKKLGLVVPPVIGPVEKVELELPGNAHHELIAYRIVEDSPVVTGQRIPRWARPSLIVRGGKSMRLHEAGRLQPGDFVYIFTAPRLTRLLDRLFASPLDIDPADTEFFGDFSFPGETLVGEIADAYDMPVQPEDREKTLAEFLESRFSGDAQRGDRITIGRVELIVRGLDDNETIAQVGIGLAPEESRRTRLPLFQNLKEIRENLQTRVAERRRKKSGANPESAASEDAGPKTPSPPPSKAETRQEREDA